MLNGWCQNVFLQLQQEVLQIQNHLKILGKLELYE